MMVSSRSTPVTVVVLTHNEEQNLAECLASVAGWAAKIFVVDSGSTDRTLAIAQQFGATIAHHPFESHAEQWTWALGTLAIPTEWALGLDADQRITPALRDEIIEVFAGQLGGCEGLADIEGFYIARRQIFRGRWIKHGGYYPKYLLKLFRIKKVHIDLNDRLDHHFLVAGRIAKLRNDLIEENRKEDDISFWIEKHTRYAELLALEEFKFRESTGPGIVKAALLGNPDQTTLRLKQFWRRLPLYVRPLLYFFYRYFLRLGFLDGKEGLIFHFMQGLWFRLLVDIKLDELAKNAEAKHAIEGLGPARKSLTPRGTEQRS